MDVITIGETMVLFVPTSIGPLRYVNQFGKTIGGAESNVAIGLARLGHQCGWISRVSNDEFGLYVRNFIRGEGVDTSQVIFDNEHPTGIFFKERKAMNEPMVYYYRKGSAASFLTPQDINESYFTSAKYLHLTGITPALSPSCKETVYAAIEIAKRNKMTIIFDPNIRLKLWSADQAREVLMDLAHLSDIVMPGLEEGEILTGEKSPEKIAKAILKNGAKLVVIKLGEKGAFYASESESGYVPAIKVDKIVDPIGAGDSFAAGFISGLLRDWPYSKAVELGNRVGAYALSVLGDVEALPTWPQVNPQQVGEEILR